MLRRLACAAVLLGLTFTFAAAEEIKGQILRVEEGKVTVRQKAKEKGTKGEVRTLDLAKDVKVFEQKGKERSEVAGGLKSDIIDALDGKKGRPGIVVTGTDNKVTEIILSTPKKKKKKA